MTTIFSTSTLLHLQNLVNQATQQQHDKEAATACYRQILQLDPLNSTALHWLAWHTTNVYEARSLLATLARLEPDNLKVSYFWERSTQRCRELDSLTLSNSIYLKQANNHQPAAARPLLGQLLLQANFITPKRLAIGLKLQKIAKESGHTTATRLGEILLECGYITQAQLEQVLKQQMDEYLAQCC
jgi:hypothetical protein